MSVCRRALAVGFAVAGASMVLAVPASAAITEGSYTATVIDGGQFIEAGATSRAQLTSCGPDCFTLLMGAGPSDMRPAGPIWTGTLVGDGFGECPRTIDPNTLVVTESCPSFGLNATFALTKN